VLSRVSGDDTVALRGDTAIEFGMTVGGGLACAAGGDSIVFVDDEETSWWESPPDSGDTIDAMTGGEWTRAEVVSSRTRVVVSGICAGAQRILGVSPPLSGGGELPLARLTRRARFMVYRGGDGAWWFGERACGGSPPFTCGAAQPVSGPLESARALHFSLDTAAATPVVTVTAAAGSTLRSAVLPLKK
jgi:hypothetical protein